MKIKLADEKEYEFKPLTLGAIKRNTENLKKLETLNIDNIDILIEVLFESFKRTYTEAKIEELYDLIDISNMNEVFFAVMNVSQMISKEEGGSEEKK